MKTLLKFSLILAALFCAAHARAEALKIDASSNDKMQESFFNILMSLEEDRQQKFASSMATIGVILSQTDGEEAAHKKFREIVNGKNADEIIDIAKKMSPQIKEGSNKINGKTLRDFNRSAGRILITLPLHKQKTFSEALAKLFYDAKQKNLSDTDIAKRLDGKTADEVIDIANLLKSPFPTSAEDMTVAPLTQEQLKESGIIPDKSAGPTPASKSLVPTN